MESGVPISSEQRGLDVTGVEGSLHRKKIEMPRLSVKKKKSRNIMSNCFPCSKTWSLIRESKQAVFLGSRWSELRLLGVL